MPPHEREGDGESSSMRCFLSEFVRQAVIDPSEHETADDWDEDDDSCSDGWAEIYDQLVAEDQQRMENKREQAEEAAKRQWESERPEDPVDEQLGQIIFVTPGEGKLIAGQTQSGEVIYLGQRFSGIRDWLLHVKNKRIPVI